MFPTHRCWLAVLALFVGLPGVVVAQIDLGTPVSLSGLGEPIELETGDFDGNGTMDLAALDGGGTFAIYPGLGDGGFADPLFHGVGVVIPGSLTQGDFDGDGVIDFAVGDGFSTGFSVLLGNGDGSVTEQWQATAVSFVGIEDIMALDFDADGLVDLGFASTLGGTFEVMLGDGTGSFAAAPALFFGGSPQVVGAGDLDGDGYPDIAIGDSGAFGTLTTYRLSQGGMGYGPQMALPSVGVGRDFEFVDMNGDGALDLVVVDPTAFWIYPGDGFGNLGPPLSQAVMGEDPAAVRVADLDLDGQLDILVGRDAPFFGGGGPGDLRVFRQVAPDTFEATEVFDLGDVADIATTDFNGDGRTDVVAALPESSEIALFLNLGPLPANFFLRGDPNGDGVVDISDAVFSLASLFIPGSPPPVCSDAADANDDGLVDVSDAVYGLAALFIPGAPSPPPPHPDCGSDPTPDALACPGGSCP